MSLPMQIRLHRRAKLIATPHDMAHVGEQTQNRTREACAMRFCVCSRTGGGLITEQSLCYAARVARPRVYDQDQILDAVEQLAVESGSAAVTIRAISAAIGVSNGAIYHTFGSRAGLAGRAWLRAGHRFLGTQSELIDSALCAPDGGGVAAVVAAADAPAVFAEEHPHSSR